jgi:hypothetical protein
MYAFAHEAVQWDTMDLESDLLLQYVNIHNCPVYFPDSIDHLILIVCHEGFCIHSGGRGSCDCAFAIACDMCNLVEVRGTLHVWGVVDSYHKFLVWFG